MNNEEILKKWDTIEKEVSNKLPAIWIRFSLPKRYVCDIPKDAETTPKKIFLYYNALDSKVYFSTNGQEYVDIYKWCDDYNYAEVSEKYDGIILLSSWQIPLREKIATLQNYNLKFKGAAPFDFKVKISINFLNIINKDKTAFGKHYTYNYYSRKYEISKEVFYGKFNEIKHGCFYNLISDRTIGLKKSFIKIFGIGLVSGNTYVDFTDEKLIARFLSHKEPVKGNSKKQQLIDELLKIKLKVPKMTFNANKDFICVASKVNEEYSVLRWFMPTAENEPYEVSRLYVTKKDHYFCRKNTYGDYIVLNNKLLSKAFNASKVIIQNKDAFRGTKLEYFESIYKDLQPSERASALYMLIAFPEFEKFYKSGLNNVCKNYLKMLYQCSWTSYVENIFGKIHSKEKNLNKILGFNKHQLELINSVKIKSNYWRYYGIGYEIKKILNLDDCSSMDNDTFDAIFNFVNTHHDYYSTDALKETCRVYSVKVCINMLPTLDKFINQFTETTVDYGYGRTYSRRMAVLSIYKDYVNMVGLLDAARYMRPHFDTTEDIVRMHDDVLAAYNVKREMVELSKFTSRISFWKKWEYNEESEKYAVVIPEKPDDIAIEGITLHHCVKSYIGRVTAGSTNIVFIREKDKLDVPFFTVEIGNAGTIEQIHGFGNRNVNTEPGLEEFVKKWTKARKLNATNYNKVR